MGSRIFERKLFFLISRCAAAKWSWRLEPSSLNYSSRYLDSNGFFFLQFNPFKLGFRWVVGEIEKRLAIPRAWRHPICDSVFKAGWLCLDALFFCCRMPPSPSVRCCVDAIGYHPEIQLSEYYLSSTSFNPLLPLRKGKKKKYMYLLNNSSYRARPLPSVGISRPQRPSVFQSRRRGTLPITISVVCLSISDPLLGFISPTAIFIFNFNDG